MSTNKTLSKVLNIDLDVRGLDETNIIEHLEYLIKIKTLSESLGLEVDVKVAKYESGVDLAKEKFSCSCMGSYPPNCDCGRFNLNN